MIIFLSKKKINMLNNKLNCIIMQNKKILDSIKKTDEVFLKSGETFEECTSIEEFINVFLKEYGN